MRVIYLITNTGTSTLTGVTLTDPAGVSFSPDIPDLAPGESWTVEGSYVITQADIDAGLISGPAEVSANGAGGAVSDDAMAELRLDRAPSIVLVKTADASGVSTPAEAGQRITYGFTVRNSGNVTLTNVRLTDDMPGLVLDAPVIRSLAPGESSSAWTAVRVITEADFENGDLRNTATGTGEAPGGGVVSDVSGATEGDDSPTVVRITPPTEQELVMTKRANLSTAKAGDVITYTITLRNDASYSATRVRVVDSLPRGLSYQPGSAAVAGTGAEPNVSGRSLSWAGLTVPGNSEIVITLRAAVTSTELGKLVNEAWAEDRDGRRISNKAEATVRIEPEHVFDCSDVFGKVFVDADGDRRQDKGERGVGGVRLRTLDGLIITTDEHGRYSVPCAALPKSVGSNHLVKIDETSLPAGLSLSGDASRTVRVTPGRAAKLNFELSQAREVEMRVSQRALGRPELRAGIAKVMRALDGRPATFKVVWERAPGESGEAVREGLGEVSRLIRAEAGKAGVRATVRTGSVKR